MQVTDLNYYPKAFKSFNHTGVDGNNNPTVTVFYENADFSVPVFTWTRTWAEGGNGFYVDSCAITIA